MIMMIPYDLKNLPYEVEKVEHRKFFWIKNFPLIILMK